jgi:hypothetical protein
LDSIDRFSLRAEPYEILAYCDLRLGRTSLALQAMKAAQRRDPHNWEYAYGLAVVNAISGQDPRPEVQLARRLNPRGALARKLELAVQGSSPARWRRGAARAPVPFE